MKKIFVISLVAACMFAANAQAQDIISMRNGQTVKAKVTEVNETSVKYSLFDEPDGPVYTVGKDDISSIEYKSGRVETFVRSSSYADAFYGSDGRRVPEGVVPGMRYKDYAKLYDPKDYVKRVDDRYSPVWGGVASAIIPGLGQMINGQVGREPKFDWDFNERYVLPAVTSLTPSTAPYDFSSDSSALLHLSQSQ